MARPKKKPGEVPGTSSTSAGASKPRCGLCGKSGRLTRTECCGNWICDDEENYVPFSYARNCCYRNHRRYTLCGYHHTEEHAGDWKSCAVCRGDFETEDYVGFSSSEYNFEKLENPPAFEPTHCSTCGTIIRRAEGGYSMRGKEYWCGSCQPNVLPQGPGAAAAPDAPRSSSSKGPSPLPPRVKKKRTPRG